MNLIKIKNKKGDSTPLTIFFVFIVIVVGTIIYISMALFFGSNSDIRSEEASSLSSRIIFAIVDSGMIEEGVLLESYDIFESAELKKELFRINGGYYLNIEILNNGELKNRIVEGNSDFEIQCALTGESLARCSKKSFEAMDSHGEIYQINILTGSNKIGSKL